MEQRINLYQSDLFDKQAALSARTILYLLAGTTAALLLVYGVFFWRVHQLDKQLELMGAQQARANERLAQMQIQFPPKQKSQAMEREIDRLSLDLERKKPLLELVGGARFGNSSGFSGYLEGLARQTLRGVWLKRIGVDLSKPAIDLEGNALQPELVPVFLQQLAQEEIFSGLNFSSLLMARPEDNGSYIEFALHSKPQESP